MRFSALGENTAPASADIIPSTDISDSSTDKKLQLGTLATFVRATNEVPETESSNYSGLTITAIRTGGAVTVSVSGTLNADIASSNAYVTIATLSADFVPPSVMIAYAQINYTGRFARLDVTTAGSVRIGYSRLVDGTAADIANGQQVYMTLTYAGVAHS